MKVDCSFRIGFSFLGVIVSGSSNIQPGPVAVLRIENSTNAHVFVKALYPEGLREIGHYRTKCEALYLNLNDLRKAWADYRKRHGTGEEPFLVI